MGVTLSLRFKIKLKRLSSTAPMMCLWIMLYGCEDNAATLKTQSIERAAESSSRDVSTSQERISSRGQMRPIIAATRAASPLARGLLQQLRGGEPLAFKLERDIDGARLAAFDGVVMGSFDLHLRDTLDETFKSSTPHLKTYRVASSELWWAHRGGAREVSVSEWRALISGARKYWPRGEPFQLCLRASPDPLEALWSTAHPELAPALKEARALGRWPIFDDDERMLSYLSAHPGAVGLFPIGNLKLYGAPLGRISIRDHAEPNIVLVLTLNTPSMRSHMRSHMHQNRVTPIRAAQIERQLDRLLGMIRHDIERASNTREWGWEP